MFSEQADAIVNTVNCVGVMGKGVALEFKRRWPENFKQYKKLCAAEKLTPGHMFVFDTGDMLSVAKPRYLINFPTKQHWRAKSKISFIEDGLDDFVEQIKKYGIKSVALPPLGCGNGGLPWKDVKALIEEKLSSVGGVEFIVYTPKEPQTEPEYNNVPATMTFERAMMVKTVGEFEKYFGGRLTRISLQKVVYFLQAMGVQYNLAFSRNMHGPYSEKLKDAFKKMEALNYIKGYSGDTPEIYVPSRAFAKADSFLAQDNTLDHQDIIHRLSLLIEGYESPYGMELLASVHYLVNSEGAETVDSVVESIKEWNHHKYSEFSSEAIETAFERLRGDGLIS